MRSAVRNVGYNLAGQLVPMAFAVVAMPLLARHAGADRLGFIGLAWALIGYFALLDLGLSRVITRRVAIAHGDGAVASERRTVERLCIGLFAAVAALSALLSAIVPASWVVGSAAPAAIVDEARFALTILWATLPATVVVGILRGALEGQQLFGRANALRSTFGALGFAAPIAVLPFSHSLVALTLAIAIGRYLSLVAYAVVVHRAWPAHDPDRGDAARVPRPGGVTTMLREGTWLTVSNLVGPIMVTFDRLVIAHLVSLAAAAYYLVPQEIALRVLVLPAAVASTMFPVLSQRRSVDAHGRVASDGLLAIACLSFPFCVLLAFAGPTILALWMGRGFAAESGLVAALISVGLFANCCAQAPFAWLQAAGRSDLTGKLHLLQVPAYVLALYLATRQSGLVGAAIVWSARAIVDYLLLLAASRRVLAHATSLARSTIGATWIGIALVALVAACARDDSARWFAAASAVVGTTAAIAIALVRLRSARG